MIKNKRSAEGQIIDALQDIVERQRETIREKDDKIAEYEKHIRQQTDIIKRKNKIIEELRTENDC